VIIAAQLRDHALNPSAGSSNRCFVGDEIRGFVIKLSQFVVRPFDELTAPSAIEGHAHHPTRLPSAGSGREQVERSSSQAEQRRRGGPLGSRVGGCGGRNRRGNS
jgi:hypothetical protein